MEQSDLATASADWPPACHRLGVTACETGWGAHKYINSQVLCGCNDRSHKCHLSVSIALELVLEPARCPGELSCQRLAGLTWLEQAALCGAPALGQAHSAPWVLQFLLRSFHFSRLQNLPSSSAQGSLVSQKLTEQWRLRVPLGCAGSFIPSEPAYSSSSPSLGLGAANSAPLGQCFRGVIGK